MATTESASPSDALAVWISALQGAQKPGGTGPASPAAAGAGPLRADAGGDLSAAHAAGAALRQLMLQMERDRMAEEAAIDNALVARWHRLGLLERTPPTAPVRHAGSSPPPRQGGLGVGKALLLRWWVALPALATVAALLLWPSRTLIDPAEPPADAGTMRGAEAAQVITAADPARLADEVEQALRRRQVPLRRVPLAAAAVQLQARLAPQDAALAAELRAMGVEVPPHGRLDLVIQAAPRSP